MTRNVPSAERARRVQIFADRFGLHVRPRSDFLDGLRAAVENARPFAAAGLGTAESHWLYYPIFLEDNPHRNKLRVYHKLLIYHAFFHAGVFPPRPEFYLKFNDLYAASLRQLDLIGAVLEPVMEPKIARRYGLEGRLVYHLDFKPDKSIPDDPANCYLPALRGKKLLIVCPYAEFLKERASSSVFEGVWSKTGKKWFYPATVQALEFPYGFEEDTASHFATSIDLFYDIAARVEKMDFDIALVAAGGLAAPIAAFVKGFGKIAIDLGGELQFLFGVNGKRWRKDERWRRDYFTDWWVDLPDKYLPKREEIARLFQYA